MGILLLVFSVSDTEWKGTGVAFFSVVVSHSFMYNFSIYYQKHLCAHKKKNGTTCLIIRKRAIFRFPAS